MVKALDLRSNGRMSAWVRTPPVLMFIVFLRYKNCLMRMAFGLASNNFIYLLSNTALCAGCFDNDFILVAYCRDSFARLAPKQGSK